jgi:hypothetical protein
MFLFLDNLNLVQQIIKWQYGKKKSMSLSGKNIFSAIFAIINYF